MADPDPDPPKSSEAADRRARVVVAGHTGDLRAARAALDDPEPTVREAAVGALGRLDAWDAPTLTRVLGDPAPRVRRRAASAAARTELARDALVALLGDEDATVVEVACFAVGERPDVDDGDVEALAGVATGHEDHLCREAAVAALGSVVAACGDRLGPAALASAEEAVLTGTRDRATVRRRAVLALAAFDDDDATDALRRLRGDRDLQVRQAAEDLLAVSDGEEVGPEQGRSGPTPGTGP